MATDRTATVSHPGKTPVADNKPNLSEIGATIDGVPQISTRRLFMQFNGFSNCRDPQACAAALKASGLESVLYLDVQDPQGIGLVVMTEDPSLFANQMRRLLNQEPFVSLRFRNEMTMIGRTYATGHERNLEDWLLQKPRRTALGKAWPWAVWYPLRRKPEFALLAPEEQGQILMEHAKIGRSYGEAGFVTDIRLASYGLDAHDNEFVIGLVANELFPISRLVQDMRKTQQTAKYIQSMGPFFVGRVFWQSDLKSI